MRAILKLRERIVSSTIVTNSYWGILAYILQTVFLTGFFVVIAREYSEADFGRFTIAMILYQLIAAFSTMGLSQWFIRELPNASDKKDFVSGFFAVQLYSGVIFYAISIGCTILIYSDSQIRNLSYLLGLNIILDNLINAVKCLNIAQFNQKKSLAILTIDAALRLFVACLLFVYPISIINLCFLLILVRVTTLYLFLVSAFKFIEWGAVVHLKKCFDEVKHHIRVNWSFLVIGGISIANFKIAHIIISKLLSVSDVALYEVSFKVFSIAQIVPVIISTSVFPQLVKHYIDKDVYSFNSLYTRMYFYYFMFGILSFTFVYSFVDDILPFAFDEKFEEAGVYIRQLFFTMLIFPTAYLQANALITMKLERLDMYYNLILLFVNAAICLLALYFIKDLSAVSLALFVSFLVFHVFQNISIVKRKVVGYRTAVAYYLFTVLFVATYMVVSLFISGVALFVVFWLMAFVVIATYLAFSRNDLILLKFIKIASRK